MLLISYYWILLRLNACKNSAFKCLTLKKSHAFGAENQNLCHEIAYV